MKTVEIRKVLDGIINFVCPDDVCVNEISIDSRSVKKGDIFFGLKGERTDGNLYAQDAIEKGAQLVVIDNLEVYKKISMNKILVRDSLTALKSLGDYFIYNFKGKIIGLTGSVGKTTTKAILKDILSTSYRTYASYKNYNNELGTAISACNIDMSAKYAIFEMGTNSIGEINELTNYLMPDIGIITSIGSSHIGKFGSYKDLAKEKISISNYSNMKTLWLNEESSKYAPFARKGINIKYFGETSECDIYIKNIEHLNNSIKFNLIYKNNEYTFKINHIYSHLAFNALPCIAIALDEGVEYGAISEALNSFKAVEKRGELIKRNGLTIIDDCYNAGFQSVISSIENLSMANSDVKIAIIGEMAEIEGFEDELYKKLEDVAADKTNINFIFCGEAFKNFQKRENFQIINNKLEAFELVKDVNEGIILVKASRGQRFEEIVNALTHRGGCNVL
jgi:UDP-N-acetylmuramoyl-tripeptide--D-alanyl-D-alanine ligase